MVLYVHYGNPGLVIFALFYRKQFSKKIYVFNYVTLPYNLLNSATTPGDVSA